jgi:hypothetical protein
MEKNRPGNPSCTAPCLQTSIKNGTSWWNHGWLVRWDDDIPFPIWWESHNPAMFQTTNQMRRHAFFVSEIHRKKSSAPSDIRPGWIYGQLRRQGALLRNPQWPKVHRWEWGLDDAEMFLIIKLQSTSPRGPPFFQIAKYWDCENEKTASWVTWILVGMWFMTMELG